MHDLAARPTGAVKRAVEIAIEIMILLNINLRIAQVRPRVEESVQWIPRHSKLAQRGDCLGNARRLRQNSLAKILKIKLNFFHNHQGKSHEN
jgi:hypothetical protein